VTRLQLFTLFSISSACLLPAILAAMPGQEPKPAHDHHSPEAGEVDVHRHGMKHDFSDVAKHEKSFDGAERAAWQQPDHVIALMELRPGMTVVDLGAGTGFFEPPLASAVGAAGKVLALDVEPNMVEHLKRRAEAEKLAAVEARLAAPHDPGLAPGSVDRILIVNTWHHIDDRGTYSAKLRTALRPEGAIYIVDFDKSSPKGPPASHKLEPREVVAELEAGGLEARQIDEQLTEQYIVVARLRRQP
jgi:cyclopropane fatty-acyl-phospholipid synthase-like methyltransferase